MEVYAQIVLYVMPVFTSLILMEKAYSVYIGKPSVPGMDMISSVSSGMLNSLKDVLGLSITILSYDWLVNRLALFTIENTIWTYIIGFIAIDFYGYWTHRLAHDINFLWNKHAIHHSSEEFNLACALRQPISGFLNIFAFLLIPAALVGVPSNVIATILPIHLFLQFWYHTKLIKKMGFLEKIIVTPSHHRVHHAINPEYMDKNHSQIFIFWDKLFGTFQEELDAVPPVFGITRPAHTWNPVRINFQHLFLLFSDAWRAENWKDRLTIWFKPTGWRPQNFEQKYPVSKITDVYHFEKYQSSNSSKLFLWTSIQFVMGLLFMSHLYSSFGQFENYSMALVYGIFIFVSVFSYTELMDLRKTAIVCEIIRVGLGLFIVYFYGNWFGLEHLVPHGTKIIISYLFISLAVNFYFVTTEFEENKITLTKQIQ